LPIRRRSHAWKLAAPTVTAVAHLRSRWRGLDSREDRAMSSPIVASPALAARCRQPLWLIATAALLISARPLLASSLWDWTTPEGQVPGDANVKGMWDGPWELTDGHVANPDSNWHSERNPVHGAVLGYGDKGKLLMYRHFQWYVYDLNTENSETILTLGHTGTLDLQWAFCSGHSFLPDGRLLITGGDHTTYDNLPDHYPVKTPTQKEFAPPPWAAIFDPAGNVYGGTADMPGHPRWYPTNLTMPDGDVWVAAGNYWVDANGDSTFQTGETANETSWIEWDSDAAMPTWTEVTDAPLGVDASGAAIATLPLYPFMHVLPSKLFYGGYQPSNVINVADSSCAHCESLVWDWTVDAVTGDWYVANFAVVQDDRRLLNHDHGTSVLLTLEPPYGVARAPYGAPGPERVLLMGGGDDSKVYPPADTTLARGPHAGVELFDLSLPEDARWVRQDNMIYPRKQVNAVLLPDGKVFVSGGHYVANPCFLPMCGSETNQVRTPVYPCEMYDDSTQSWSLMADLKFQGVPPKAGGRNYHSFALLLPDGRVLTAGNQHAGGTWDHLDPGHNYEIFYPPYLFDGNNQLVTAARPQIASAPSDIFYGQPFFIEVDDGDDVSEVMLIAPSVATHANNMSQRRVLLEWEQVGTSDSLVATAPWHGAVAPPGDYMLFRPGQLDEPGSFRGQIPSPGRGFQRGSIEQQRGVGGDGPALPGLRGAVRWHAHHLSGHDDLPGAAGPRRGQPGRRPHRGHRPGRGDAGQQRHPGESGEVRIGGSDPGGGGLVRAADRRLGRRDPGVHRVPPCPGSAGAGGRPAYCDPAQCGSCRHLADLGEQRHRREPGPRLPGRCRADLDHPSRPEARLRCRSRSGA
jgi:hypothetical protein